jgi:hypothetical protein
VANNDPAADYHGIKAFVDRIQEVEAAEIGIKNFGQRRVANS